MAKTETAVIFKDCENGKDEKSCDHFACDDEGAVKYIDNTKVANHTFRKSLYFWFCLFMVCMVLL